MPRVLLLGALCAVVINVLLVNQIEAQGPRGESRQRSGGQGASAAAAAAAAKATAAARAAAAKAAAAKAASYYYPPPPAVPAPAPVPVPVPPVIPPVFPINPDPQPPNSCPNGLPASTCASQCVPGSVCRAYPDAECRPNPCAGCAPNYFLFDIPVCCDKCPSGFPPEIIADPCAANPCTSSLEYCRPNYCRFPDFSRQPYDCIPFCVDAVGLFREPECLFHPCQFVTCRTGFHCEPEHRCSCNGVCVVGPPPAPPIFPPIPPIIVDPIPLPEPSYSGGNHPPFYAGPPPVQTPPSYAGPPPVQSPPTNY